MKRGQEHVSHCLGHEPVQLPSANQFLFSTYLTIPPTAGLKLLSLDELDQQKDLEVSFPREGWDGEALETPRVM